MGKGELEGKKPALGGPGPGLRGPNGERLAGVGPGYRQNEAKGSWLGGALKAEGVGLLGGRFEVEFGELEPELGVFEPVLRRCPGEGAVPFLGGFKAEPGGL